MEERWCTMDYGIVEVVNFKGIFPKSSMHWYQCKLIKDTLHDPHGHYECAFIAPFSMRVEETIGIGIYPEFPLELGTLLPFYSKYWIPYTDRFRLYGRFLEEHYGNKIPQHS